MKNAEPKMNKYLHNSDKAKFDQEPFAWHAAIESEFLSESDRQEIPYAKNIQDFAVGYGNCASGKCGGASRLLLPIG